MDIPLVEKLNLLRFYQHFPSPFSTHYCTIPPLNNPLGRPFEDNVGNV